MTQTCFFSSFSAQLDRERMTTEGTPSKNERQFDERDIEKVVRRLQVIYVIIYIVFIYVYFITIYICVFYHNLDR